MRALIARASRAVMANVSRVSRAGLWEAREGLRGIGDVLGVSLVLRRLRLREGGPCVSRSGAQWEDLGSVWPPSHRRGGRAGRRNKWCPAMSGWLSSRDSGEVGRDRQGLTCLLLFGVFVVDIDETLSGIWPAEQWQGWRRKPRGRRPVTVFPHLLVARSGLVATWAGRGTGRSPLEDVDINSWVRARGRGPRRVERGQASLWSPGRGAAWSGRSRTVVCLRFVRLNVDINAGGRNSEVCHGPPGGMKSSAGPIRQERGGRTAAGTSIGEEARERRKPTAVMLALAPERYLWRGLRYGAAQGEGEQTWKFQSRT